MAELDRCPFCSERDAFVERGTLSSAYVVCNSCGAKGPEVCQDSDDEETPGEAAAIRHWNTRKVRNCDSCKNDPHTCIGTHHCVIYDHKFWEEQMSGNRDEDVE